MGKKLISEFVGTMLLVIFGCGTAVAVNQYVTSIFNVALPFTMILIAAAFGLVLMSLVYTIGDVSGCHVNPAVSIAMLIDGRMSAIECVEYILVQIIGAIAGAEVLALIFGSFNSLGANGYGAASALGVDVVTLPVALAIEMILTFTFVLVVLAASKKGNENAGVVIGLALMLVHIMGIPFTGTSVNPARSIGPALLQGGDSISQMWVFIVAPLVGAILAALFFRFVLTPKAAPAVAGEVEETKKTAKKTKKDE